MKKKFPLFYYYFVYVICIIWIIDAFLAFIFLHNLNKPILNAIADGLILAIIPICVTVAVNNYKKIKKNNSSKNYLEDILKPSLLKLCLKDTKKMPDLETVDFIDLCNEINTNINNFSVKQFQEFFYSLELDYQVIISNKWIADSIDEPHGFLYGGIINLIMALRLCKINEEKNGEKYKYEKSIQWSNIIDISKQHICTLVGNCLSFHNAHYEDYIFPSYKPGKKIKLADLYD